MITRFSLLQLTLATAFVAVSLKFWLDYGFALSVIFGILGALAVASGFQAATRWSSSRRAERVTSLLFATVASGLFVFYSISICQSTYLARDRSARLLQFALARNDECRDVHVEYVDWGPKGSFLLIKGSVESDAVIPKLRAMIDKYDWRSMQQLRWELILKSQHDSYYELEHLAPRIRARRRPKS